MSTVFHRPLIAACCITLLGCVLKASKGEAISEREQTARVNTKSGTVTLDSLSDIENKARSANRSKSLRDYTIGGRCGHPDLPVEELFCEVSYEPSRQQDHR